MAAAQPPLPARVHGLHVGEQVEQVFRLLGVAACLRPCPDVIGVGVCLPFSILETLVRRLLSPAEGSGHPVTGQPGGLAQAD